MISDRESTRSFLKTSLRNYVELITEKSKGAFYVCPLCGSGRGANKTGALSIKDNTSWKCFSCGAGGDIFDLIGLHENITSHNEQLQHAIELFKPEQKEHQNTAKIEQNEQKTDYRSFFLEAHKNINDSSYAESRGLTAKTINRFKLGFVKEWHHPKAPSNILSPRLIIPTSETSYLARDTREQVPDTQKQYIKSKVGALAIFNAKAFNDEKISALFVVEGEIDALSIMEIGGEAVALGSTVNLNAFLKLAEKTEKTLIISLDNDDAGEKATEALINALSGLGISSYSVNLANDYKDVNERLKHDYEGLKKAVKEAGNLERSSYLETANSYALDDFIKERDNESFSCVSTGFNSLDSALDGGFYEGLHVIGAISSLGKTTFIMQLADCFAMQERDVLFFSLEMAKKEIIAKSLSRLTVENVEKNGRDMALAKSTRAIMTDDWQEYSKEEKGVIELALIDYEGFAKHIYTKEGAGETGVKEIREAVKRHFSLTGNAPVVIVDYLQILAPYNERATDKQNTDKAVLELKRISRDYKTPVIAISSFNRANYKTSVSMEAFKESGAIEYSSDVLMGLQFQGAEKDNFNLNEAKLRRPRDIELIILKNRNGEAGASIKFKYYSRFNYFKENEEKYLLFNP